MIFSVSTASDDCVDVFLPREEVRELQGITIVAKVPVCTRHVTLSQPPFTAPQHYREEAQQSTESRSRQ